MFSLATALVRDGTARYSRWRRRCVLTRNNKIPKTVLTGKPKHPKISQPMMCSIQRFMTCGCRVIQSTLLEHSSAMVGGLRFNAGEKLVPGVRCGSVITMVRGGRSIYGLVKHFFRVVCTCDCFLDLVCVTWFPLPEYPDGDPLTVRIRLNRLDINNIRTVEIVPLFDIQPSRVIVEIDRIHDCMYMLRIEGLDTY